MKAIIINCVGFILPITAPNEMSIAAATKSATIIRSTSIGNFFVNLLKSNIYPRTINVHSITNVAIRKL